MARQVTGASALQRVLQDSLSPTLKVAAGAVQDATPYVTLAGSALTVDFRFDPSRIPFQRLPWYHPNTVAIYNQLLLEVYLSHIHLPSLNRTVDDAPFLLDHDSERTLSKLGLLSTKYLSISSTAIHRARHPASGSIELLQDTHRRGLGLNISLWDSSRHPLSHLLLTGPQSDGDSARHATIAEATKSDTMRHRPPIDAPVSPPTATAAASPCTAASSSSENDQTVSSSSSSNSNGADGGGKLSEAEAAATTDVLVDHGGDRYDLATPKFRMLEPIRRVEREVPSASVSSSSTSTSSSAPATKKLINFRQKAIFAHAAAMRGLESEATVRRTTAGSGCSTTATTTRPSKGDGSISSRSVGGNIDASTSDEVLPWHVDQLMAAFAYRVATDINFPTTMPWQQASTVIDRQLRNPFLKHIKQAHQPHRRRLGVVETGGEFTQSSLRDLKTTAPLNKMMKLVSCNFTTTAPLVAGKVLEIVCAEPKRTRQGSTNTASQSSRPSSDPWASTHLETGLPQTGNEPCLSLRCEVRQGERVALVGTCFFGPCVEGPSPETTTEEDEDEDLNE